MDSFPLLILLGLFGCLWMCDRADGYPLLVELDKSDFSGPVGEADVISDRLKRKKFCPPLTCDYDKGRKKAALFKKWSSIAVEPDVAELLSRLEVQPI